jgi:segregation and condensation protein A
MTTPFDAAHGRPEFESGLERFPVKLEMFEGPLDLLLHLIKKHELDIYDIPIALITRQYLDYIGIMEELQLDVAGDFLVMAATLIHIKSRSLLPRPAPEQEDPEEDPREALVRRLIEHQKFKAAAELLHDRETVRSAQWGRPDERIASLAGEGLDKEPELEVDLFSLMTAFKAVVERAKQRPPTYLPMEQMSIEQRIEQLTRRLDGVEALGFEDLFEDVAQRADLIVTFLAVLEMIRLKVLRVFQTGAGGPIRVYKRDRPAEAPRPIEYHEPHHARPHGTPGSQS